MVDVIVTDDFVSSAGCCGRLPAVVMTTDISCSSWRLSSDWRRTRLDASATTATGSVRRVATGTNSNGHGAAPRNRLCLLHRCHRPLVSSTTGLQWKHNDKLLGLPEHILVFSKRLSRGLDKLMPRSQSYCLSLSSCLEWYNRSIIHGCIQGLAWPNEYSAGYTRTIRDRIISVLNHSLEWDKFIRLTLTYPTPDSGVTYTLTAVMPVKSH